MKVIQPVPFKEEMLVSTTATETYASYSSGTTYALGAKVVYSSRIYESLQNSNTNHSPDTSSTWWLDVGPDNRHAMFDSAVSTSTTATTILNVVLTPGIINSLAFINLDANEVTVTVRNGAGGPIVYQATNGLQGNTTVDWYMYFFNPTLIKRTQLIFSNIPPYVNSHVTIEISNVGLISLGALIFGNLIELGSTQYGVESGIIDYSIKQTDDFGNTTFVQRAYSKRMSAQIDVRKANLNYVQQILISLRSKPCVWIGSESSEYEEAVIVFGFYKEFSLNISYPTHGVYSLEVEGLT